MSKKTLKFVFLFLIVFLFSSNFVLSQGLETNYPEIGGIKPETVKSGLPEYVRYVFNFGIVFFGLVVFAALMWGGFLYLTSAGNPDKLKEATSRITSAFLGIIILLSSYILLTSINPQLVTFNFPLINPLPEKTPTPLPSEKSLPITLIASELPLGQVIENGVWSKARRIELKTLVDQDDSFLREKISVGDKEFERISDLNKYLKSLTDDCQCQNLQGICTKPKNFAGPVDCTGDPCKKETREKIETVLKINQEKIKKLSEFSSLIIEKKTAFEKQFAVFQDIEGEMLNCETQSKLLFDLNEQLSRENYFREQGWGLSTVKIPGAPENKGDPLTFFCSVGGNIFDQPYNVAPEIPSELTIPELYTKETPEEELRISCPTEFPLGEIVDEIKELGILLMVKMEKLADLHNQVSAKIERMAELVSQCNDSHCKMNCACVPNVCFEPICGLPPARVPKCNQGRCSPVIPPGVPNPCYPFCDSPCLQAVGVCTGQACDLYAIEQQAQKIKECFEKDCSEEELAKIYNEVSECNNPCPRKDLVLVPEEIKGLEDEMLSIINEIRDIFPRIAALLGETPETSRNLKNIRNGMDLCYSSNVDDPTWALFNCASAQGNYGPTNQIIDKCYPRNFFCCSLAEQKLKFPWEAPAAKEPVFSVPSKKYQPLPSSAGCPEGWVCDPDVKNFNQYADASEPLKELISCMRKRLDKFQQEEELRGTIGLISSISDSRLYSQACSWDYGFLKPPGCSHSYYIKYGKEIVSAHYGGPVCRSEHKSYALDLGDEQNAKYLIAAAKECYPGVYINFRTPGHYDHIHISIGEPESCGSN